MIRPGCKHVEGPLHDCDQVDERDAIAAHAARVADERCPRPANLVDLAEWRAEWDRTYHDEVAFLDAKPQLAGRVVGTVN